ncbi:MAG: endonuclease/exonuclease/phosphatase family protein [Saprospiraceae bacterium]|nr:MAG: endonuclease/exonuclease/phosphatase family protein [Saprospiraceae bacterium]
MTALFTMISKLLSRPIVQIATAILVALSILVSIYPASIPPLSQMSNYAVQLMEFYFIAGLFFLFIKQPRFTFIFFGGCAVLCLFLRYSIKNSFIDRWRQTVISRSVAGQPPVEEELPVIKIAHFNVSNAEDMAGAIATIRASQASVISIHEVTPQWDQWLRDSLSPQYPFHHTLVDIGMFGMAIYSKYELKQVDTFYYRDIPNLRGVISIDGSSVGFISTHTEPALNDASKQRLRDHLGVITGQARSAAMPVLVLGEFNAVSWSDEIQVFRDSTGLLESRTGFISYAPGGMSSFFDVPLDHVFYSQELECIAFSNLFSQKTNNRLGITATFRLRKPASHVQKTAR